MTVVTKVFQFHAAHRLLNHQGKCRNLHGHTYKVEVTIVGPVHTNEDAPNYGMVLDFDDLKEIWIELDAQLDHKTLLQLNDPLYHDILRTNPDGLGLAFNVPPTAENIAARIWAYIGRRIPVGTELGRVRVWETPTSFAEVGTRW